MKTLYDWYFPPSAEELDQIWDTGVLTVDANVLLDLYRYHDTTREELLQSLNYFRGRAWLTHQAAEEFVRHRTAIIAGAAKTFQDATKCARNVAKFANAVRDELRGYRLISRDIAERAHRAMTDLSGEIESAIASAEVEYPDYLSDDPILEKIAEIFEGAVGGPPSEADAPQLLKEAEDRRTAQVPPGYLDDKKDGDRPHGDFFLWIQVLERAKERQKPMILVTSERKDDWWERKEGKRTGPRPELMREAFARSGQRVMLFRTEHFVELVAERRGQTVAAAVVEEIRDIGRQRDVGAVSVVQQYDDSCTPSSQAGYLTIVLSRPVRNATGTGRLFPQMVDAPRVWASLASAPPHSPRLHLASNTGTTFDFNVHFKPSIPGEFLPIGEYRFRYSADCSHDEDVSSNLDDPQHEDNPIAGPGPSLEFLDVPSGARSEVADDPRPPTAIRHADAEMVRRSHKMRTYELAREFEIPNQEMEAFIRGLGITIKNYMSTLSSDEIWQIRTALERK